MGFNYGLEKRKFTEEWKKLNREYKAAGNGVLLAQMVHILLLLCF